MMFEIEGGWVDEYGQIIPMPGTSHPDMGQVTMPDGYRKNRFFAIEWSPGKSKNDFDKTFEQTVFNKIQYMGPAPYVGDSRLDKAYYIWDAWVAADGRWIGGKEARLVWRYKG